MFKAVSRKIKLSKTLRFDWLDWGVLGFLGLMLGGAAYAQSNMAVFTCSPCTVVDFMGKSFVDMGTSASTALGPALRWIVVPVFTLYIYWTGAKLVNPNFIDIGPGEFAGTWANFFKTVFFFALLVPIAFSTNSFALVFPIVFEPPIDIGLGIADVLSGTVTGNAFSPDYRSTNDFGPFSSMMTKMLLVVEKMNDSLRFGIDFGWALAKTFSITNMIQGTVGIVILAAYAIIGFTFGMMFLKVMTRLIVVATLVSVFVVFVIFPQTRAMTKEAFKVIVHAGVFMAVMGIVTQVVTSVMSSIIVNAVNDSLAENESTRGQSVSNLDQAVYAMSNGISGWDENLPVGFLLVIIALPFIVREIIRMGPELAQMFSGFSGGNDNVSGGAMAQGAAHAAGKAGGRMATSPIRGAGNLGKAGVKAGLSKAGNSLVANAAGSAMLANPVGAAIFTGAGALKNTMSMVGKAARG